MSAYSRGIATNQTQQPSGYGTADPNKPWMTAGKFYGAGTGSPSEHMIGGAGWGPGRQYNAHGAQGAGYYGAATGDDALGQQQYFANQFRNNIPTLENQLGSQMAGHVGAQMDQGIKATQQQDSTRGLLYGGLHAGREQGVRATAAGQLAQGRSAINAGVNNAANSMDNQAIQTGVQIQQQQQQMQNAIYSQAMAKMSADNQAFQGLMGAAGMAAGGAMAGGLL